MSWVETKDEKKKKKRPTGLVCEVGKLNEVTRALSVQ